MIYLPESLHRSLKHLAIERHTSLIPVKPFHTPSIGTVGGGMPRELFALCKLNKT